ncbi:MAG: zinc-binding dehydrogenase [Nitrospinaceae bacterium]|nr:zinc-binding dehydrogenase [Nitrospinaceae bacterium]NIR53890.1 zinc-binding dehydrogenase [Nitrospinaceae bacterium]NIS84304.1 zinc-binding dehydrogenase [Nitrospinaceae bacterium]NIT81111.1 zinc-binding dehydrogenase [Nitrospinaceae bacterium]NIU43393.1 zinc-binding dehydrogenase [Nitrospinaceae bacterium]
MKALILDIKRDEWESTTGMTFAEVDAPVLDEAKVPNDGGRVLIKPIYTGFCGSDKGIWFRHAFKDMIFDSLDSEGKAYRVCGHELLGEVVETGSYAANHYGYRPGDIVTAESHIFCGLCHQCKIGEEHVCANHLIIGISTDGCFAETVKLPAKELWRTDIERIRPEVAAIQEPLGNAVHACSRVDLRGKTVAIFGCGTIGLFSILVARSMGATTIIGIDPNPKNLEMAGRLGIDHALKVIKGAGGKGSVAPDPEIVNQVRKACFGEGVDVVLEMSGSNQALNTAIAATRAGGDVILFGLSSGDYTLTDFEQIVMHGKTMHSIVGRKVFQTWYIVNNLLTSQGHDLQDKIWEVILNKGEGTIFPFHPFDREPFEQAIQTNPKSILKY